MEMPRTVIFDQWECKLTESGEVIIECYDADIKGTLFDLRATGMLTGLKQGKGERVSVDKSLLPAIDQWILSLMKEDPRHEKDLFDEMELERLDKSDLVHLIVSSTKSIKSLRENIDFQIKHDINCHKCSQLLTKLTDTFDCPRCSRSVRRIESDHASQVTADRALCSDCIESIEADLVKEVI